MPKQQPTELGSSRDAESKSDAGLRAAIASAIELQETVEWCRERRSNPKGHTAPPPNMRILEARVTDAVRRHARRVEEHLESQRKHAPDRLAEPDVLAATYFSAPEVLRWIAQHLPRGQLELLSTPSTDERLCDHVLEAAVAQAVDNTLGLAVPELRARASALGWALVSPAQYADFYREEVLPAWSRQGGKIRLCLECGGPFALGDKRQRYCSDACAARRRNRGRQKVGKGRSAPETDRKRNEERLQRHLRSCKVCNVGEFCATWEAMFQADALSRRSFDVTPEIAEETQASSGRRRKRGAR